MKPIQDASSLSRCFPKMKIHLECRVSKSASQANLQPLFFGARFSNFKRPEIIEVVEVKLMATLKSPLLGIFAGGDATSRDFHTVPLTRRERDVPSLIINTQCLTIFVCNIFYP